ncbi:hypothetical protein NEF87_005083 [Candidatus Lokiarchaeum ossiferum]|uniref:Right handed beta helix domain-containing protein n=1 Tax=Candidatus Lokiarchaeum ossiferum TaxID=2951803 RepID=A0ABY6HZI6_9ARCH|nr:hypothetical protein NEF87_005083 [Candidatus Lokiarchaeum sp. B-35]
MKLVHTYSKKQKISFITILSIIIASAITIPIILHNSKNSIEDQTPPNKPQILESLCFTNNSALDSFFENSNKTGLNDENSYQLKNLVFNTTENYNPHYGSFSFAYNIAVSLTNITRFVKIINCTFQGYSDAISLINSENIEVSNCSFIQCLDSIHIIESKKIQIRSSVFFQFYQAVKLYNSTDCEIFDNYGSDGQNAISLRGSPLNEIKNNEFFLAKSNNKLQRVYRGIALFESNQNSILDNTVGLPAGFRLHGLRLESSNNNNVSYNSLLNCSILFLKSQNNSNISSNTYNGGALTYLENQKDFQYHDTSGSLLVLNNCSNVNISSIDFISDSYGVVLHNCSSINLDRLSFTSNLKNQKFASAIWIEESKQINITHSNFTYRFNAIFAHYSDYLNMNNNIFDQCDSSLEASDATSVYFSNNQMENSTLLLDTYTNLALLEDRSQFYSNRINGKNLVFLFNQSNLIFTDPLDNSTIFAYHCHNISIGDFSVAKTSGILLRKCTEVSIRNVNFTDNFNFGIYLMNSDYVKIEKSRFQNQKFGIFTNYGTIIKIHDNSFISNGIGASLCSLRILEFNNNLLERNGDGIKLWDITGGEFYHNVVSHNFKNGINTANCEDINIQSNEISNNDASGILIVGTDDNCFIIENIISQNQENGVSIFSSREICLSENIINMNKFYGLFFSNSIENIVYFNEIRNNSLTSIREDINNHTIWLDDSFYLESTVIIANEGKYSYSRSRSISGGWYNFFEFQIQFNCETTIDTELYSGEKNTYVKNT